MVQTLTGDNSYLLQRDLRQIVDGFVKQHGDLALEKLDGEEAEFNKIQQALQSLPFLSSKKLVVLRSPGANKKFSEAAEALFKDLPETTDLIIVEPKLDKRSSYYKLLKKVTDFKEFTRPDDRQNIKFIESEVKRLGGGVSSSEAQYLLERVGGDQELLGNEIKKLLLFDAKITRVTIDELTEPTPQSRIFDLIDAAFAGNHKKALKLYAEQRAQKVEPQAIIGMLAYQLHVLALVKAAGKQSSAEIAASSKISPYAISKSQNIARRISASRVRELAAAAVSIDYSSKTKSYDLDEALQNYILQL